MNEAWTAAIEALSWVEVRRVNEDLALSRALNQLHIEDRGTAKSAKQLVYEVLKRENSLDYIINDALDPYNLTLVDVGVRSFLRLYTYMIHYGGSSFQEAHNLIEHTRGLLGEKKLRTMEETIDLIPHIQLPWTSFTRSEALSYRYFHPEWYIEYLQSIFNEEKVIQVIEPAKIHKYIRVNTLKTHENVLNSLFSLGFQFTKVPNLRYTYEVLEGVEGLVDTAPYHEGKIIFQDKASVLVGEVASPKHTDLVLDICAAPGVKTSHLAQLMSNRGRIISVDYDNRRLSSWRILMKTMGVLNAEFVLGDASKPSGLPDEMADLVVLDPPCTGTGTFNEYPSGKWRLTKKSIQHMAELQRTLIANAAAHVADNGTLIYSTCSLTFEENEAVIINFLKKNPSFALKEANPKVGEQGLEGLKETQRLFPHSHGCQGFFIARLEKNN